MMQTNYLVYNKEILDGLGKSLISSHEIEHKLELLPRALQFYCYQSDVSVICEKQDNKVFVNLKTKDINTNLDNIIQEVLLNMNQKKHWLSLVAKVLDARIDM